MSTKDLWKPGMVSAKTPLGIETQVAKAMNSEAIADFLAEVDLAFVTDPERVAHQERKLRRAERWDRQQAPLRAWAEHYRNMPEDENKPVVGSEEYDKLYRQFLRDFHAQGPKYTKEQAQRLSRDTGMRKTLTEDDVVKAHGEKRVMAVKERSAKS